MIYNPQPRDPAEESLSKPCDGAGCAGGEDGSDAVAHWRALYRCESDQWEAFRG